MDNKTKEKLLNCFYPTEQVRSFMCNDFYQELLNLIPISMCISARNRDAKLREQNFLLAKDKIKNFVLTDKIYNEELFKHYHISNFNDFIERLLEGYVFYIVSTNARHKKIDMYKDNRSIFYKNFCFATVL